MFRKLRLCAYVLLAIVLISSSAYAATSKYKDTYTTEDGDGNWTFTGRYDVGQKANFYIIDESSETTSAVTAARTGYTFIIAPSVKVPDGYKSWVIKLPATANGLTYRFISDTATTISIKPYTGHSRIAYRSMDYGESITSPATRASIELTCYGATWYIKTMWPFDTGDTVGNIGGAWLDGGTK